MGTAAENLCFSEIEDNSLPVHSGDSDNKILSRNKPSAVHKEVIKVIAVGGGGGNALNHIISKNVEGVDFMAANTDVRSLEMSLSRNKIVLGERVTKGLGAGAKPDIGAKAAQESVSEIREYLKDADMVYLAAGMGGGTGTGAISVIAETAREMGILTVAVVTKPFSFEGSRRMRYAEEGIEKLRSCVDALIIVPNDKLLEMSDPDTEVNDAFAMADEVLRQAVQGVTDLVTRSGKVNVDFADLRSVMKTAGTAVMGIGSAKGENRMENAVKQALESPLMECSMSGASGVLMNITCGSDLGILEVQEAAAYIENIIDEDATFVWGCVEDPDMEGSVEIVMIATGFDNNVGQHRQPAYGRERMQAAQPRRAAEPQRVVSAEPHYQQHAAGMKTPPQTKGPSWLSGGASEQMAQKETSNEDFFDTPTFSRLKKEAKKPQEKQA